MLVNYEKNSVREFEFVKKVDLTAKGGKKYSRMFWKLNESGEIATYMELGMKFNREDIEAIRELVDDRIVGFSFGKKPKSRHEPEYAITLDTGKTIKLLYSELKKKLESLDDSTKALKLMLEAPFLLGKNMIAKLEVDVFQSANLHNESTSKRLF